jgi:hypothetical protein
MTGGVASKERACKHQRKKFEPGQIVPASGDDKQKVTGRNLRSKGIKKDRRAAKSAQKPL